MTMKSSNLVILTVSPTLTPCGSLFCSILFLAFKDFVLGLQRHLLLLDTLEEGDESVAHVNLGVGNGQKRSEVPILEQAIAVVNVLLALLLDFFYHLLVHHGS